MSFDELYQKLRNFWIMQAVESGTGASEAEIAAFESTYQIILPDDVRSYFLKVNGMKKSTEGMDNKMMTFYSLKDVKPLSKEMEGYEIENAESYFVFADYNITSWYYAVQLSGNTEQPACVFRIDIDGTLTKLERSFSRFIERYFNEDIIYS